jgi:predicted RNase H-like nuclease (RuvC/YqgF family)
MGRSVASSQRTKSTSKSCISSLRKQLIEERDARKKLEDEILEIKRISSEISGKLRG